MYCSVLPTSDLPTVVLPTVVGCIHSGARTLVAGRIRDGRRDVEVEVTALRFAIDEKTRTEFCAASEIARQIIQDFFLDHTESTSYI